MRIDKAGSESRINYPLEGISRVPSDEKTLPGSPAEALRKNSILPELYKPREIHKSEACILHFSYRQVQVFDNGETVIQGVFEEDIGQGAEMRHHFSSWKRTVGAVLERGIKKGMYVDKVV